MAGRLDGKVAIVTGSGSRGEGIGNGRAAAVLFAREGAKVVLVDRDQDAVAPTLAMIEEAGGTASIFLADLTDEAVAKSLVDYTVETYGRLDVVQNNVGTHGKGTVVDSDAALWEHNWDLNVMTMVNVSKYAVPVMAAQGGGSIVNVSSISAIRPRGLTPYSATKGAVIALTQAMAIDHAADRVRVNCVAPGPVFTPHVSAAGMSEELREQRKNASPLRIEGTGWDVAYASLYFACDESRWITGVVMPVDGGVSLTSASR